MMSCSFVNAEQASKYFEHTTEYYTKNMTNYDRWHGSLAQAYGLDGELSKEQFDEVLKDIAEQGRERAGLDCTFSAPKSVSLAMAKDEETRQDMIISHQKAVEEIAKKIELALLQTRTDGKKIFSRNAIMAEFMHTMARPTKSNDDIPDLDLHSHCVFLNKTVVDGKDLALDFEKVMSREKIKEYGLVYRQELAKELQNKGYELEITDSRQGFFEIKGFDRESALRVIEQVERFQKQEREATGRTFVYLGDEFYFLAGKEVPPAEVYDGFPQLDNGIGLARNFMEEFSSARNDTELQSKGYDNKIRLAVMTGTAVAPMFRKLADELAVGNLEVTIVPVPNNHFGTTVNVSGLLTAHDMKSAMDSLGETFDGILIPESALRAGDNIFLDDVSLDDFKSWFHGRVETVGDGRDYFNALTDFENYQGVDGEAAAYMWQSNAAYTKRGGHNNE